MTSHMAAEQPPCLSATAQTRILVWRSEVASAFDPPDPPHSTALAASPPSASSSSSTTVTTTASLLPRTSRSRRFLRRVLRRLSARTDASSGPLDPLDPAAAAGPNEVLRTAMYRAASPPDDPFFDELGPSEPSARGGRPTNGTLKDKQDRLRRASRLLLQQNAMGVPARVAS